jgi:hypothetical protein
MPEPAVADAFLARRFNFLGLPSERKGGAVSYAGLRAELGDDNAAALVTRIGEMVTKQGIEALGIPLHQAVDRVVQSLTPDERRTVAVGGTVARVQALISAEISQAETQQKANRTGTDESKTKANGQYAALGLQGGRYGAPAANDGSAGNGKEMSSYERQQTEQMGKALALAEKYGLGWAANNPDLLRLGPSAIQALADVKLQQESYQRFQKGGLSAKTIVDGARWAKKNGVDLNEASRAYEGTHQQLTPEQQKEHQKATEGLFKSYTGSPAEQEAAKKRYNEAMEGLKKSNPGAAPHMDREQRTLKTAKQQENAATATAEKKEAKVEQAASKNDDLMASLNDKPAVVKKAEVKPETESHKPKAKTAAASPQSKPASPTV